MTQHQALTEGLTSMEGFCARMQRGLAHASFVQRRQLVELLIIDRVVVTDGEVEIPYVIPTSPASERTSTICAVQSLADELSSVTFGAGATLGPERMQTALRERVRVRAGRELTPSAAILDSQSVKSSPKGGHAATRAASR